MYKRKMTIKDFIMTIIGTGLMALAVQMAYEPSHLVTGGFSSIGILIKNITSTEKFSGVPIGLTTFLLNVPLFIWGFWENGLHFIKRSLLGMLSLSLWLTFLPVFTVKEEDLVLTALVGGVLTGAGIGLVLMRSGTTGGTDMLATLIHRHFPQYSIVRILQLLDGMIVVMGAAWFGINRAIYALVAIFVSAKLSDSLLDGLKYAKMAHIITSRPETMAKELLEKMDRGVTAWEGQGMYTHNQQTILWCVVGKKEIVALRNIVHEIDEKAFLIVSDAREVYGEGFLQVEKY